jgi:hypothetical protein
MTSTSILEMRSAVASEDWPAVLRLWEAYAAGILQEIAIRTCTPARLAEAREFLKWAERTACCSRAHNQEHLNAIHAAEQYSRQAGSPLPSLRTSL